MKKILYFSGVLFLFSLNQIYAQGWVGNRGGKILYPVNSSLKHTNIKVGIGTKKPSTSLHLEGTSTMFRLADGSENTDFLLMSDSLGNATWQDPDSIFSGIDHDWYKVNSTSSPTSINDNIFTMGSVGVGYDSEQTIADLSVEGDIFSRRANGGFHRMQFGLFKLASREDIRFGIMVANSGNGFNNNTLLGFSMGYNGTTTNTRYETTSALNPSGLEFRNDRIRFLVGTQGSSSFTPNETLTILNNGNVGIGTSSPISSLDVNGDALINRVRIGQNEFDSRAFGVFASQNFALGDGDGTLYFAPRNLNPSNGAHLSLGQRDSETGKGDVNIVAGYFNDLNMLGKIIMSTGVGRGDMVINENGNVGIGTTLANNPENYKLAIMGKVGVYDDLIIENTSTTWADYVFESNYQLLSLDNVEDYIRSNKHLPNVPSAEEVRENGVNVVEMDATLLRKIEELTLYMIDMKNQNERLEEKVSTLEKRMSKGSNQ